MSIKKFEKLRSDAFSADLRPEIDRLNSQLGSLFKNLKKASTTTLRTTVDSATKTKPNEFILASGKLGGNPSRDWNPATDNSITLGNSNLRWKQLEAVDVNIAAGHTYNVAGIPHTHSTPTIFPDHSLFGMGTSSVSSPTRQRVFTISEDFSDLAAADYAGGTAGLVNGIYIIPNLNGDLAGFDFNAGEYNIVLGPGFDSTDQAGSGLNTSNIRGHFVNILGTSGGTAIGTLPKVTAFDMNVNGSFPTGQIITNLIGYDISTLSISPTPTRSYGIRVTSPGNGTTAWAGMFGGRVQITGTNPIMFGSNTAALAINSIQRGSTTTNLTMTLNSVVEYDYRQASFAPVSGATAKSLGLGTTQGWSGLFLQDTAASFTTQLKATNSSISANRILTLDTSNADRTLKLTGNPTIADWFDQSVKQAASPTFAGVTISDGPGFIAFGTTTGGRIGATSAQLLAFWGATPISQPGDIGVLTDSTTGSIDGTLVDVGSSFSQSTLNDNFADLADKVSKIRTALRNIGLTA